MPIRPENAARYPSDWKEIRERILARAGDRCEWCGAKNGGPHPKTGAKVVLTIAHVYDKRPEVAHDGNLAALCQKCHLGHDLWDHHHRVPYSNTKQTRISGGSHEQRDA